MRGMLNPSSTLQLNTERRCASHDQQLYVPANPRLPPTHMLMSVGSLSGSVAPLLIWPLCLDPERPSVYLTPHEEFRPLWSWVLDFGDAVDLAGCLIGKAGFHLRPLLSILAAHNPLGYYADLWTWRRLSTVWGCCWGEVYVVWDGNNVVFHVDSQLLLLSSCCSSWLLFYSLIMMMALVTVPLWTAWVKEPPL